MFPFPFAENKRKLPLSVSSVFRMRNSGNMETWTRRHGDMETWRHGYRVMETWRHRHGDMEKWRNRDMEKHGDMKTWTKRNGQGDMETSNGKQKPRLYFHQNVYRLLIVHSEVCRLSVCWPRNKRELSVCKRTKWSKQPTRTCLSTYMYREQAKDIFYFNFWRARH